jgi:hypothetical protein
MELEKPQPEQVVIDLETEKESENPMAAITEDETARENSDKSSDKNSDEDIKRIDEDLPPGTIQACYRPYNRLGPLIANTRKPREKPFIAFSV